MNSRCRIVELSDGCARAAEQQAEAWRAQEQPAAIAAVVLVLFLLLFKDRRVQDATLLDASRTTFAVAHRCSLSGCEIMRWPGG